MSYWRHGKLERETGYRIDKILLVLLREYVVQLVSRAAVSRHERIHCVVFGGEVGSGREEKEDDKDAIEPP